MQNIITKAICAQFEGKVSFFMRVSSQRNVSLCSSVIKWLITFTAFELLLQHLWHFEYMEKTLQWETSLLEVQMR